MSIYMLLSARSILFYSAYDVLDNFNAASQWIFQVRSYESMRI